jgi:hypothetical protein
MRALHKKEDVAGELPCIPQQAENGGQRATAQCARRIFSVSS